ncbi:apoptosis regulatory protein Siva-like [Galleria mellonella]|uniref:Apoptosis regulatory protein Siva-like n=1 Tax=Galleria mellonella TaxID=7137 RepID=A0A6J3CEU8_GALME|nr:apoptosis regulatory protein Siva-like [Galleria mellonella]XP_031769634.1 apoptosis regulatory protein Siva-like [Galleria mellonella]
MISLFIKMAKRANPFTEDFMPQSKIHVGLKQFNNNEDRLQKVYEKTLDLLFKGAKKPITHDLIEDSNMTVLKRKDNMKQLVIGKNGNLLHSSNVEAQKSAGAIKCNCSIEAESSCAYCERSLCVSCQRQCVRCDRPHCSHCSLTGSEGAVVCVSCYG